MRNTTPAIPNAQPLHGYLPTLDGWRAVAIGIVLLTHDRIYSLGRLSTQTIHSGHGPGGVELFFSISGLLICSRLLEEERLNATISLKNFYLRRCFRIQPAAWVYLSFIALLMRTGVLAHAYEGIGYSLLMVRNYFPLHFSPRFWYTDHFWSLSVEEHFYLFLPIFLSVIRKRRVAVLLSLVLVLLAWNRLVGMYPALQFGWELIFRTDFAAKGLLLSSAVALALTGQTFRAWCQRWVRPILTLPVAAAIYCIATWHVSYLSATAALCAYPLMILSTLLHPQSTLGQVLEWPSIRYIGRISYSIYLWQMPFFPFFYPIVIPHSQLLILLSQTWLRYPTVLTLSILSYHCIEKPFIRLGHRLVPSAVPGRGEASVPVTLHAEPDGTIATL